MKQQPTNVAALKELNASAALPEVHDERFPRAIIATILAAMFLLFVWAASTPVTEITTGTGVIQTRAHVEHVEHPDGGIVARLEAVPGQRVDVGTRLLVLDTDSLEREMSRLRAARNSFAAELGRVAFVLENKGTIPDFATLDELSSEELLFWAEQSYLAAQLDLIYSDSRARDATITILEKRRKNFEQELEILGGRLARNRKGLNSGAISLNAVEQLERERLQLERAILEIHGEIASQRNAMDSNLLKEAEIIANRQREAALRRAEIEEQMIAVTLSMSEVAARIERAVVRASVAGTIMELSVSNPREVLAPGELIAEIVPDEGIVEAEVEVSADEIGSVLLGMEARMKVLSYDFTRFGEIVGRVTSVSPSSYETETGETVFRVVISLPNHEGELRLGNRPVLPGMTVSVDIMSDSKNVLTYLLKPLRALGDHAFTEA
ncbi:MAG: HlyD family type I secretion periplasmic adaptor subunit [Silicimonas sp.]|nr:HlyD family type I secretion periplasmic adaptor subunit [Silicimonas sp.]